MKLHAWPPVCVVRLTTCLTDTNSPRSKSRFDCALALRLWRVSIKIRSVVSRQVANSQTDKQTDKRRVLHNHLRRGENKNLANEIERIGHTSVRIITCAIHADLPSVRGSKTICRSACSGHARSQSVPPMRSVNR